MKIAIIGNPTTNSDAIKKLASSFLDSGLEVRYPSGDDITINEDFPIIDTFNRIDWADTIIAVPKEGLSFGQSMMAEVAYAKHSKKPVLISFD